MRKHLRVSAAFTAAFLVVGCVSPATLRPVAKDNETNIENYVSNVITLLSMYKEVLGPLLNIRYGLTQQTLLSQMRKYETTAGAVNRPLFQRDVSNLSSVVNQIASIQNSPDRQTAQENLLRNNPIIADVALNRITESDAIGLLETYFQTANTIPSAQQQMLDLVSRRFFVTSDALSLHEEIRLAYSDFVDLLTKQGRLGIQHSKAIGQFSNANASFESAISVLTSDSVKKSIAEIVRDRTADPKRKAAAEAALSELADAAKKKGVGP